MPAEESTAFHQAEDGAPSYIVGDSPDDDVMAASCTSSPDQSETSEIRKLSNRQKNVDEEGGDSAYSSTAASEGFSAADCETVKLQCFEKFKPFHRSVCKTCRQ